MSTQDAAGRITCRHERMPWTRHLDAVHRIQAVYQPQQEHYPIHDHEFIEVVVVASGTALHRSVGGDREIGRGDAFLFRPGAWHGYDRCSGLAIYNCCFAVSLLGRELEWAIDHHALGRLLWTIPLATSNHGMVALTLDEGPLADACCLLDRMCGLSQRDSLAYRPDYVGLLTQVLGVLARALPPDARTPPAPRGRQKAIQAVLKLIDGNPAHDWTLQELAAKLLVDTCEPIGAIGNRVGWPDANYFTRRFRKQFGLTPTEYRKRYAPSTAS